MKSMFHGAFACAILISMFSIYSMERPGNQQAEKQSVIPVLLVLNKTGHKLVITYQTDYGTPISVTLDSNEEVRLNNVLDRLAHLYVNPYGKFLGWGSVNVLTRGYVAKDLAVAEEVQKSKKGKANLRITIKPAGEGSLLGGIWGAVAPYIYEFHTIKILKGKPQFVKLVDYFPQVVRAAGTEKKALPRYFLNLPESADVHQINIAFERIKDAWEARKHSENDDQRELAHKVIDMAEAARNALLNKPNDFNKLIENELTHEGPIELYSVEPDIYEASELDPLLGLQTVDLSKLTEEEKDKLREDGWLFPGDKGYIQPHE